MPKKTSSKVTLADIHEAVGELKRQGMRVTSKCVLCANPDIAANASELFKENPYSAEILADVISQHYGIVLTGHVLRYHEKRHGKT